MKKAGRDFLSKSKADTFAKRMKGLGYKIRRSTSKPYGSIVYAVAWRMVKKKR